MRVETIGNATLYCGNSLEVLPSLSGIHAVVTDPPYGVNVEYGGFSDDETYIQNTVLPIVGACRVLADRVALTPGQRCAWLYPRPDDIGVWFNPAGTGFGKWGFMTSHLILYYGKDPHPKESASSVTGLVDRRDTSGHPCSKPVPFMRWLVAKTSHPDETILDPFMGSGSTGVACMDTGRKFIGVELNEKFFDLACRRLDEAQAQQRLFA